MKKTSRRTYLKSNTLDSQSGGIVIAKIPKGIELDVGEKVNGHYPVTLYVYAGHLTHSKRKTKNKEKPPKYNSFWKKALAYIAHGEGFRSQAYLDSVNVPTINV